MVTNTPPKKQNRWSFFSVRSIWRLRYRAYAILVMVVLIPVLYSSSYGIPPQIDVVGYTTLSENILYDEIMKTDFSSDQFASLPPSLSDSVGQRVTQNLRISGINPGISDSDIENNLEEVEQNVEPPSIENPNRRPLDSIVPRPANPQRVNFLRYPKYNINAPLIYSTLNDLFLTKPNCDPNTDTFGCLDFTQPRDNNPVDSPVQRKLQEGIVHIAFTPLPGEVGNSYIVGHSSNYSWVPSAYNSIFKPLERRSQVGEEFIIYDHTGRELKFRVIEVLEILENDTATAYKDFGDRRIVTLQTSILEFVPGQGLLPTKRWLTRGELIL